MAACAASRLATSERLLKNVFAEVEGFYEDVPRRALQESQDKWLAYRDSYCDVLALNDGTIRAVNVPNCKAQLTEQRIETLCAWVVPNASLDAVARDFPNCRRLRNDAGPSE
jgi:uncharacterized protein YecT (DUF1311 family)